MTIIKEGDLAKIYREIFKNIYAIQFSMSTSIHYLLIYLKIASSRLEDPLINCTLCTSQRGEKAKYRLSECHLCHKTLFVVDEAGLMKEKMKVPWPLTFLLQPFVLGLLLAGLQAWLWCSPLLKYWHHLLLACVWTLTLPEL